LCMIGQQIETKSSRAYFDAPIVNFLQESADSIVGAITSAHAQDIVHAQTNAWRAQIALLKKHLVGQSSGHIFFEFTIPRMGNRADVVLLVDGIVFVLEFKIGSSTFHSEDLRQAEGYALDLKHFHEGSNTLPIVTILLATEARPSAGFLIPGTDDVYLPIGSNGHDLSELISRTSQPQPSLRPPKRSIRTIRSTTSRGMTQARLTSLPHLPDFGKSSSTRIATNVRASALSLASQVQARRSSASTLQRPRPRKKMPSFFPGMARSSKFSAKRSPETKSSDRQG
jgi:hypothetical protein